MNRHSELRLRTLEKGLHALRMVRPNEELRLDIPHRKGVLPNPSMFASFEHRAAKIFVLIALTVLARRLTRHMKAQAR